MNKDNKALIEIIIGAIVVGALLYFLWDVKIDELTLYILMAG